MESSLSCLSSLKEDASAGPFIQPHYKESYRLAIYALVSRGREAYQDYLKAEQISDFLSEEELTFIQENAELPVVDESETKSEEESDASTYFPTESDEEVPDLDLGWPEVAHDNAETNVNLLFHPPRHNAPTIKEVIRKHIQEARQVIAIAMDVFTDVDIFKEIINATSRGVVVYILLDNFHFKSFLTMSERSGVRIQDLKNVRVRTVKGQQYKCRSGATFYGTLEQRFILLDSKTALYGTYSYMWSYEKINLSMVLMVTGQLAGSYDEEFRRLFARSSLPAALSQERVFLKEPVSLYSPASSHSSLHLLHLRSRTRTAGLRSSAGLQGHEPALTRGLSIQDRLNHAHRADAGRLLRGYSFAGDLQKVNLSTKLHGVSGGRNRSDRRSREDLADGKMNPLRRHASRYHTEQNALPFNSDTSLRRWKIESYLKNSDPLCESNESLPHSDLLPPEKKRTPMPPSRMRSSLFYNSLHLEERTNHTPDTVISPHGSQSGIADHRPQLAPSRWMENQTRLEEIRLKGNSLQENKDLIGNLRSGQSQDSLKSVFLTLERAKERASASVLDKSESVAELEHSSEQPADGLIPRTLSDDGIKLRVKERDQTYATTNLSEAHRSISVSHYDITTLSERKNPQSLDWNEPLCRTTSEANLGIKLMEPSLKSSNFRPTCLNVDDSRMQISLIGIPEESPTRGSLSSTTSQLASSPDAGPPSDKTHTQLVEETPLQRKNSERSATSADSQHVAQRLAGKERTMCEQDSPLQRKNSIRHRLSAIFHPDEQKTQTREEPGTLQRGNSLRAGASSSMKHLVQADISAERRTIAGAAGKSSVVDLPLKGQRASAFGSYNTVGFEGEKEQYRTAQLVPSQSTGLIHHHANQESLVGSRITLEGGGSSALEPIRKKAYSRFEHFLSVEKRPSENVQQIQQTSANPEVYSSDKNRSVYLSNARCPSVCSAHSYTGYQTPTENKFGRFIQRVGHLINKNK